MAIGIYSDQYSGTLQSTDGTFTDPIIFKAPPAGGTYEKKLWLRHEELSGELGESSYGVVVDPTDDFGSDESTWLQIAPDSSGVAGTYGSAGASHSFGDILVGNIVPFWVKATIPPSSSGGVKEDIYLKLTSSNTPQYLTVDMSKGTFTNVTYDASAKALNFDVMAHSTGEWQSEWIDISSYSGIDFVDYAVVGNIINLSYRGSTAGTDATADAWVGSLDELDPTRDFFQARVGFTANSFVGQTGLVQRIYGNTDFSVFKVEFIGAKMPYSATPGESFTAPKSVKWTGQFYAELTGLYTFRCVSNDGHRIYVDSALISDHLDVTSGSTTLSSTTQLSLLQGWHAFEVDYIHSDGDDDIKTYITTPASPTERNIALTDFSPTDMVLKVTRLRLRYIGAKDFHYDMRFYNGPDVPRLISPVDGFITPLFSPTLILHQQNCEYVEYELDNVVSFDSVYLADWIVACTADTDVSGNAPDGARPPGTYYWRARGISNGVYSEWSDYRFLTILPLVSNPSYLSINVNIGLATHDPIIDARFLYEDVNIGIEVQDPIENLRFFYENVNISIATGRVIYPIQDITPTRKLDFDGDQAFLDRT